MFQLQLWLQVYLWDQRGGSAPRTKLGSGLGFSMNTLQLSEDANLLLVGAQTGDVSSRKVFPAFCFPCFLFVNCFSFPLFKTSASQAKRSC